MVVPTRRRAVSDGYPTEYERRERTVNTVSVIDGQPCEWGCVAATDNVEQIMRAWQARTYDASWTLKDTLLYALAVGARPSRELPFVYESYGPKVLSTFATRLAKEA